MQKLSLFCLVILVLAGCASSVIVNSDYPEGVDFQQLKTYRWQDSANQNASDDEFLASAFVDARIHSNVDTLLRSKGYLFREQGPVDFLVSYKISSEKREDLRSYGGYYDPWWSVGVFSRHRSIGYGVGVSGAPRLAIDYYLHASWVLDFVDAETHQLVWRGKGEGRVPDQQTAEKRRAMLERIVSKILKDFPSHISFQ